MLKLTFTKQEDQRPSNAFVGVLVNREVQNREQSRSLAKNSEKKWCDNRLKLRDRSEGRLGQETTGNKQII